MAIKHGKVWSTGINSFMYLLSSSHFMPSTESLYVISLVFFSFYLFIRTCLHCSRVSIQCEIVCCACPLPGASRKSHESCDSLIRNWNYLSTIARINIIWNYTDFRISNCKFILNIYQFIIGNTWNEKLFCARGEHFWQTVHAKNRPHFAFLHTSQI